MSVTLYALACHMAKRAFACCQAFHVQPRVWHEIRHVWSVWMTLCLDSLSSYIDWVGLQVPQMHAATAAAAADVAVLRIAHVVTCRCSDCYLMLQSALQRHHCQSLCMVKNWPRTGASTSPVSFADAACMPVQALL